ncbi:MAG: hypothetical protein RL754_580 [Bacteroidota bacterium]|jgi:hypothetical protein
MKTLNENWFAFTLIAVIFGLIGFLLGRTTGHHGPQGAIFMGGHGPMHEDVMIMKGGEGKWITEDIIGTEGLEGLEGLKDMNIEVIKTDDGNVTVTIDSVKTDGGEKRIRVIKKQVVK